MAASPYQHITALGRAQLWLLFALEGPADAFHRTRKMIRRYQEKIHIQKTAMRYAVEDLLPGITAAKRPKPVRRRAGFIKGTAYALAAGLMIAGAAYVYRQARTEKPATAPHFAKSEKVSSYYHLARQRWAEEKGALLRWEELKQSSPDFRAFAQRFAAWISKQPPSKRSDGANPFHPSKAVATSQLMDDLMAQSSAVPAVAEAPEPVGPAKPMQQEDQPAPGFMPRSSAPEIKQFTLEPRF